MKKFTIATLVGAIILFIYSSLSWMVSPLHIHTFHYAPKQDSIMNFLGNNLPGEGAYLLPTTDNRNVGMFDSKYREATEDNMKKNENKPIAVVFYSLSDKMSPMQIVMGFLIDLFAVMFAVVIFVMAKDKLNTFFMRWWMFLLIGFIVALNSHLMELNWMHYPWHYMKGMVVDTIVEWGLCGAWLAWYLGRV
jgi:hypothetical protein